MTQENFNSIKEDSFYNKSFIVLFLVVFCFVFFFLFFYNPKPLANNDEDLNASLVFDNLEKISANSYLVGDLLQKKIILEKNKDLHLYPASIAKLVEAMVVIDHLPLDKEIKISRYAVSAEGEEGGLQEGEVIKVIDLLKILLISSSNDAALAFEEEIRLIDEDMVDLMNQKVRSLGMANTAFFDPRGIDRKGNFTTASDLFILAQDIYQKYPLIGEITQKKEEIIFSSDNQIEHHLINTNILVGQIKELWGGKTGTTPEAGDCLITFYEFDKREVSKVDNQANQKENTDSFYQFSKNEDKNQRETENQKTEEKIPLVIIVLGSNDRFNDTLILYKAFKSFYYQQ